MKDYHFKHYTLTVSGQKVRLYNWKSTRVMYPSPVMMAILTPLVEAKGDVVAADALIASAKGARRAAAGRQGQGRSGGFSVCLSPWASRDALRTAASRLRTLLGAGAVQAVMGQGYRMGWSVRLGGPR